MSTDNKALSELLREIAAGKSRLTEDQRKMLLGAAREISPPPFVQQIADEIDFDTESVTSVFDAISPYLRAVDDSVLRVVMAGALGEDGKTLTLNEILSKHTAPAASEGTKLDQWSQMLSDTAREMSDMDERLGEIEDWSTDMGMNAVAHKIQEAQGPLSSAIRAMEKYLDGALAVRRS